MSSKADSSSSGSVPHDANTIEGDNKWSRFRRNPHTQGHSNSGQPLSKEEEARVKKDYSKMDEEQAEEDHLSPASWYILSTLFPLIAATFGPMASAFSICAIVDLWRTTIISSSTEAEGHRPADPAWISSINAISLAIAIAANLFLLALMTRRLPFNLAMPATIIGWLVAASLLIGIIAAAPADAKPPAGQQRTFTQGYYYAILAAALYILMSILLLASACGVWLGKFDRHFKLTLAQRTLMFQVVIFLGYILCAAAVYARVESWDYLDAVYWVTVTALTIGFGDYSPKTHLGRGLLFPMAVGAILFVGLIIASIRSLVLERTSTKVVTRMFERAREKALKHLNTETGEVKLDPFSRKQVKHKGSASSELKRRKQEFDIMRSVQQRARFVDRLLALSVSLFAFAFLWFIGAVVFWQSESNSTAGEDWSYFQSLYFTYVSLLTIGYGDLRRCRCTLL
ncbi:hypothetical protein BDV97DRAFT_173150 [Delphinella strobiligena]|nr:hypothetical protein BDV97DRAFT_173150 [Delphinella strobiligena]